VQYDYLGTMRKTLVPLNSTTFSSDHFGYGLAANDYFIAIGAPAEGCVYVYPMPTYAPVPPVPAVNTTQRPAAATNVIIAFTEAPIPQPTPEPVPDRVTGATSDQAWLYALIGSLVLFILASPVALYLLIRWHRNKIIKELKAMDAAQGIDTDAADKEPEYEEDTPEVNKPKPKFFAVD
jgi:hypothetical protein